jgi:hypothetical protein
MELLERYARTKKGVERICLVYDGKNDVLAPAGPASRGKVDELFSSGYKNADRMIVQLIERLGRGGEVSLVTEDRSLRREAKAFGAQILPVAEMMSRLSDKNPGSVRSSDKPEDTDEDQINAEMRSLWEIH